MQQHIFKRGKSEVKKEKKKTTENKTEVIKLNKICAQCKD